MKESVILRLSILLAFLVFAASFTGLVQNTIYQDIEWFRAQYLGQDAVTLFIVIPLLLVGAHHGVNRNDSSWRIVYIAVLLYLVYTYAIFVFAAAFSPLYFLHLPIFSLSLFILLSLVGSFFISRRKIQLGDRRLRIAAAIYLFMVAAMLSIVWLSQLLKLTFVEGFQMDTPDGKPLMIIYSLDLGVMVPLMLTGAIGLIRNHSKGIAWGGIMICKTALMGFALIGMTITAYISGFETDNFLVALWSILAIVGLVLTTFMMSKIKDVLPA